MTSYEWAIEAIDGYGDILSVDHADTYAEAAAKQRAAIAAPRDEQVDVEVCLVYNLWDDYDGDLETRQWAYVVDGVLPTLFDGGKRVPKRFIDQVAKEQKP